MRPVIFHATPVLLALLPLVAAADTVVPGGERRSPPGDGRSAASVPLSEPDRCTQLLGEARTKAAARDGVFQFGRIEGSQFVRDVSAEELRKQHPQFLAAVLPEPPHWLILKPELGWSSSYGMHDAKGAAIDRLDSKGTLYMNHRYELRDLVRVTVPGMTRDADDEVWLFRSERHHRGRIALLQASGMAPATLQIFVTLFRPALDACMAHDER